MNSTIKRAVILVIALICVAAAVYGLLQVYQQIMLRNDSIDATNHFAKTEEERKMAEQQAKERAEHEKELVDVIKKAVLDHYGVGEFPEILYQDKTNLLGELVAVRPTNPGAYDGQYSLDFVGQNNMGTWTQDQARAAATIVMQCAGPVAPDLQGITANLAIYIYYSGSITDTKVYADQHVGREVLSE